MSKYVSCEFDNISVDVHLCKLLDTPAAPFFTDALFFVYTKVGFCGVRTNHTRGNYPGYYPTKNICEFCMTVILVPGTSGSSVQHSYPYPELLEVLYASAIIARGTGTSFL